jgi:hypothetical protein
MAVIPIQMHTPVSVAMATCDEPAVLRLRAGEQPVADDEGVEQLEGDD